MLYADKAALENRTKLRLLAIRERELTLYTQNCFTIGTVSALMAGLAYSSLLYTKMDYFQDAGPVTQSLYVVGSTVSMYLALRAMTGTTLIAMFGPGKALRGPDGSMHETVDGMLEEFEKAGISFQGSLYSFVFCLGIYGWTEATRGTMGALMITGMAMSTAYFMLSRTSTVETTFPLYSIPLVSGAFFKKTSQGPGGASHTVDPAASLQADADGASPGASPAASRLPPSPAGYAASHAPPGGGDPLGGPVLMADRAPALPPHIAQRHTEQAQLVAEARARSEARKASDKGGKSRQKDAKWYQRLR